MIRIHAIRPLCIALALTAAPAALASEAGSSAAKVNGTSIPAYRIEFAVKSSVAQGQADTPELRKNVRETLINQEVVAQEAMKRGLEKQPMVAARLELQKQSALADAYIVDYFAKNPISEETLRKEYDRQKAQAPAKEYRLRHILVEKEDEAKGLIAQIKKGGSFEKLAAEHSKDTGSKGRGGDLDWGPVERYVKPFSEAAVKLKKGQMTDVPVHTDFGYHIIRLDDERPTKIPTFEEAKPQMQQVVQAQMLQKLIGDLRAKAKIE